MATQTLSGIKVVDLTRVLTGPYCTMMLGDMGADVVKIEQPGKGDDTRAWGPPFIEGESAYYLSINRNKRSITLNLKSDEGQEIIGKLIDEADVVVENFKPGATKRLGLDYESVRERKSDIVYTSISGGEVVEMLDQASVPCGPISTLPEVFGSDDAGAACARCAGTVRRRTGRPARTTPQAGCCDCTGTCCRDRTSI